MPQYPKTRYAITSGQFYEPGEVLYAAGVPRSSRTRGKVFVYQFPSHKNRQQLIKDILDGEQYGEYFGSALTACDVNSDGRDNLIIGASLWSRLSDEGRVYAYVTQFSIKNV
ncbi:hypothetical protein TSAR_000648 [Trichomalopsis sarcophagae]|uniref:Integrin alpha-2 domain-containing protein n=1 Tax=Trichomalopsis sarcophagae TaxID=543379 RepID=A0A232F1U2_9HYME|nr:hypothetical protein TSAR_000648 [Trichomalopsis sarcophagae]